MRGESSPCCLSLPLTQQQQQQQHLGTHGYCKWTSHEAGFARMDGWPDSLCAGSVRGATAPTVGGPARPHRSHRLGTVLVPHRVTRGSGPARTESHHFTTRLTSPKRVWRVSGVVEACAGRGCRRRQRWEHYALCAAPRSLSLLQHTLEEEEVEEHAGRGRAEGGREGGNEAARVAGAGPPHSVHTT